MNNCDRRQGSEAAELCKPNIPENLQDMNDVPYQGSFQQLLYANIGRVVTMEYITGLSESKFQTGIIESVNARYIMLKSLCNNSRMVGDVFSVRGFTFPCETC